MDNPTIRTITLGLEDAHPLGAQQIRAVAARLAWAQKRFEEAGYEVQTVRLSTRPLFDDLADWSASRLLIYARTLHESLLEAGLNYCSLGPAQAASRDFPLERIELIPDLLKENPLAVLTVQLAEQGHGIREEATLPTARVMLRLAQETEEGFGNFNFAALACVQPGTPFFPAAYHRGRSSLATGLQGASIVAEVAHRWQESGASELLTLEQIRTQIRSLLEEQARPVVELAQTLAREAEMDCGGIDLSPAPMGEVSIGSALEGFGYGNIGEPGTLALAAAVTRALKESGLPTCGYNGLMLPVLEDTLLGKRWAEGRLSAHELLLYSTICGTGLDTLPLPGDTSPEQIAHLLLDVAALAYRLNKPLSARLFPVPGKRAGEATTFTSPYLTNTLLR